MQAIGIIKKKIIKIGRGGGREMEGGRNVLQYN